MMAMKVWIDIVNTPHVRFFNGIIKKLKKGKYVAAFDYLESVEKYNFYSTKKKRKKEKHKQKI